MTTQNKAVTCYLPKDIEDFITRYCTEYGITRKDKEGNIYPSLGTGIIELLKLLAVNPELVNSPLPDTVPSNLSEIAIEKKIEEVIEKKLTLPSNALDKVPDLEDQVKSIMLNQLPSMIPEHLPSHLLEELKIRIEKLEKLLKQEMTPAETLRYLKKKGVKISQSYLYEWANDEKIPETTLGKEVQRYLTLKGQKYQPIEET